jgi:DNA invertase Pin-like site-specific DNA recombinase
VAPSVRGTYGTARLEIGSKTGRAVNNRAEFKRLRQDIAAGKIKRLFLYKYDRLGRAAVVHVLVEEFERVGCEIRSVTEGQDAIARGIHLVLAKGYSDVLAQRTRDGLKKRFQQAAHTGGEAPYGYRVVRNVDGRPRPEINPDEVEAVRRTVCTYLSEPVGLKTIARRLDQLGVQTRRGGPWSHTTVRGLLTNRWLVGEVRYHQRQFVLDDATGNRVPKKRAESEHMTRREESLRIVSDEEFEAVQRLITARSRKTGATKAVNGIRPFTGHIFCGECGSVCYSRKSKNKKGEYHYYNCGCRQRKGPNACPNSGSVREDKLVDLLVGICGDIIGDADAVITGATKLALKQIDQGRAGAAHLERQMAEIDAQTERLTQVMMNPLIDTGALTAFSRQISEQEAERK